MGSRLLKIERDQLGTRGGKGDLYVPAHRASRIIEIVADEYDLPVADMLSQGEHLRSPLAFAAIAATVYALRTLTGASLHRIAELTNYTHHSSVIHALHEVEKKQKRSQDYADALTELLKRIHATLEKEDNEQPSS
jgi:chromosomal replication initiation ATPase DnaA